MTAKLILEVALRVLSVWLMIHAVVEMAQYLGAYSIFPAGSVASYRDYLWASVAFGMLQLGIGLCIFLLAPGISARIYPNELRPSNEPIRIGSGDLYHTATYTLGAYFLVLGIESIALVVARMLSTQYRAEQLVSQAATAIVYTFAGLLLVFGARRLAETMALVRHDPDSIPQQQFSLKLLLGTTVAVAMLLGAIRMATMNGP